MTIPHNGAPNRGKEKDVGNDTPTTVLDPNSVAAAVRAIDLYKADLGSQLIDREIEVMLAVEAYIAEEHFFMHSKPGLAKSALARAIAVSLNAGLPYFSVTLCGTTEPQQVFGPVDMSGFDEQPSVLRYNTRGYLPEAVYAFLDEIWKASGPTLNSFLNILNEGEFVNGADTVKCPLQAMICASNEYPADADLDAVYDRVLYRRHVTHITAERDFMALMRVTAQGGVAPPTLPGGQRTVELLRAKATQIREGELWSPQAKAAFVALWASNAGVISDRRWCKLFKALAVRAALNGNDRIELGDLDVLVHCMWDRHDEFDTVFAAVEKAKSEAAVDPVEEKWQSFAELAARIDFAAPDVLQDMKTLRELGAEMRALDADHTRVDAALSAYADLHRRMLTAIPPDVLTASPHV